MENLEIQSELVRNIPLKQLLALADAQLRLQEDREHIELFKGLYEEEQETQILKVPPIEVFLLQSGDPATAVYPIADGWHRFTAAKELKIKQVRAIVRTDQTFTTNDVGTAALKHALCLTGLMLNARQGKALNTEERIKAARQLREFGDSIEDIANTGVASVSVLYRWFSSEISDMKKRNGEIIAIKAEELKAAGKSEREIAKEMARDPQYAGILPNNVEAQKIKIHRALVSREDKPVQNSQLRKMYQSPHCSDIVHRKELPAIEIPKSLNDESVEETLRVEHILHALFRIVQGAIPSEHLEDRLRLHFLPLLREKFPTIDNVCTDQGDPSEISGLRADYKAIHGLMNRKNMQIVQLQDKVDELEREIASRREHCNELCDFTYERLRKEVGRLHEFILARVKEHVDVLHNVAPDLQKLVKRLTYSFVLPSISMFEWSADHGAQLTTFDTIKRFEEFEKLVESSRLSNELINKRLDQLRNSFSKLAPQLATTDEAALEVMQK